MLLSQQRVIEYGCASWMLKSLTLNVGDNIAHCNVHPRHTASSAFSVVLGSCPNTVVTRFFMAGTRDEPPITSTEYMSDADNSEINKSELNFANWWSQLDKSALSM